MAATAEHAAEKPKTVTNTVVWFDLPVQELDRAMRFYSAVLGSPALKQEYSGMAFAVLPHEDGAVSGCLTPSTEFNQNKPSAQGPLMYFNCQSRLDAAIAAVAPNGGKVLPPRHPIGPLRFPRRGPRQRRQPHRSALDVSWFNGRVTAGMP